MKIEKKNNTDLVWACWARWQQARLSFDCVWLSLIIPALFELVWFVSRSLKIKYKMSSWITIYGHEINLILMKTRRAFCFMLMILFFLFNLHIFCWSNNSKIGTQKKSRRLVLVPQEQHEKFVVSIKSTAGNIKCVTRPKVPPKPMGCGNAQKLLQRNTMNINWVARRAP